MNDSRIPEKNTTAKCPQCGSEGTVDLKQWPPREENKVLHVHFICDKGHKFKISYQLR